MRRRWQRQQLDGGAAREARRRWRMRSVHNTRPTFVVTKCSRAGMVQRCRRRCVPWLVGGVPIAEVDALVVARGKRRRAGRADVSGTGTGTGSGSGTGADAGGAHADASQSGVTVAAARAAACLTVSSATSPYRSSDREAATDGSSVATYSCCAVADHVADGTDNAGNTSEATLASATTQRARRACASHAALGELQHRQRRRWRRPRVRCKPMHRWRPANGLREQPSSRLRGRRRVSRQWVGLRGVGWERMRNGRPSCRHTQPHRAAASLLP